MAWHIENKGQKPEIICSSTPGSCIIYKKRYSAGNSVRREDLPCMYVCEKMRFPGKICACTVLALQMHQNNSSNGGIFPCTKRNASFLTPTYFSTDSHVSRGGNPAKGEAKPILREENHLYHIQPL